MKKKYVKIWLVIIVLLVASCGIYLYWYGTVVIPATYTMVSAKDIGRLIESYIDKNDGIFPSGEDDLIQNHYLMKRKTNKGYKYFYRPYVIDPNFGYEEHWTALPSFSSFLLKYDVNVQEIEEVDGLLYNNSTKKKVLLITGPYKKYESVMDVYETVSFKWYKLMVEKQRIQKEPK